MKAGDVIRVSGQSCTVLLMKLSHFEPSKVMVQETETKEVKWVNVEEVDDYDGKIDDSSPLVTTFFFMDLVKSIFIQQKKLK